MNLIYVKKKIDIIRQKLNKTNKHTIKKEKEIKQQR